MWIYRIAMLALGISLLTWRRVLRRRLRAARDAGMLPSGGPQLALSVDRAIDAAIRPALGGDEVIEQQAFAYDRRVSSGADRLSAVVHYVALTNHRLAIAQKRGRFTRGPRTEPVRSVRREDVTRVETKDELIVVHAKGAKATLFIPLLVTGVTSANQSAFLLAISSAFETAELPRAVLVEGSRGPRSPSG